LRRGGDWAVQERLLPAELHAEALPPAIVDSALGEKEIAGHHVVSTSSAVGACLGLSLRHRGES
jgi:hypothetical protein